MSPTAHAYEGAAAGEAADVDEMPVRITYGDMRNAALDEAARIGLVQDALVRAGLRRAPDAGEKRRQAAFATLVRLIDRILDDEDLRAHLRARPAVPTPAAVDGGGEQ